MMQRDTVLLYSRRTLAVSLTVMTAGVLFSIALSSVAFAFAGAAFLALALLDPHSVLKTSHIDGFILAWTAAVLVMVAFAIYPASSLGSAKRLLLVLVVFFLPAAFPASRDLRRFLIVLAVAAGLQSLLGILHQILGNEERLGLFQHYMTGGGLRMILLLLFLPLLIDRGTPRRERAIIAAAVALMLVALVLTMTRSSWLGFAAGAVLIGALRYRMLIPALAVVLLLVFLIAPRQYRERLSLMFTTQKTELKGETGGEAVVQSNQSRMRMWRTGWQMFLDHPVVGVGDGEMYMMYREYVPDAIKDEGGHLHNTYIHVLATHGAVGLLAMLALFGAIAWREWRIIRREKGNATGALALGALAAFTGFLVNGMAEYNFGDHEIVLLLWMTFGLVNAAAAAGFRWTDDTMEST
ncbi:MAG: O-antigen ligase family protein [Bacteroidetes bacterium]|nr:O-antigen ligase family protein [Bacteroidota bacterium]